MVEVTKPKFKVVNRCGNCKYWSGDSNYCEFLDAYYRKAGMCEAFFPRGKF